MSTALMQPSTKARPMSSAGETQPCQVSSASVSACSIASIWVVIIRRRRSMRSDQTPPSGANNRIGTWLAKPSSPRTSAESVSR
jgi:hypothetical protein